VAFETKENAKFHSQARQQTGRFSAVVDSINEVSSLHPNLSNELEILGNRIAEMGAHGSMVDRRLTAQLFALNFISSHFSRLKKPHVELKNQMETYF